MTVLWQTLTLSGFGTYRDTVEVAFSSGINVCIGGNETGKSTLAAGIAAIIYGLQANADPRSFGQGRFRNWYTPSCFEGTLTFSADGQQYRIHRNFDNHRVSLQLYSVQGWQEEAGGEHNPNARKINAAYETKITEILGVRSRELFYGTFFVAQPLPEEKASLPEVARLLSGGTHYQDALQSLAAQLKEITRYTGRLGVTGQDMRQDRVLELLEKEIEETEQGLEDSNRVLTALQQTSAALADTRQKISQVRGELTAKESLLQAWQRWRTYRDRYGDALLRQSSLTEASEQCKTLLAAMRKKENKLSVDYARFTSLPEDTGDVLATLCQIADEEKRLMAEQQESALALASVENKIVHAKKVAASYADVQGREMLPADCRTLQKLLSEEHEILSAAEAAQSRLHDLLAKMTLLPALDKFGTSPAQRVSDALEAAKAVVPEWRNYSSDLRRLTILDEQLKSEFALFEEADQGTLELVNSFEATRFHLEAEVAGAQKVHQRLWGLVQEAKQAQHSYNRLYSDLEELGEDGLLLVEEKLGLLQAVKTHAALSSGMGHAVGASIAGLVAGGAAYLLAGLLWVGGLAAAMCAALYFVLWRLLFQGKRHLQAGQNTRERLHRINVLLGPHAAAGEAQLGEIRLRLKQRTGDLNRLTALQTELPGDIRLQEAENQLQAAKEALSRFYAKTQAFTTKYTHLPEALEKWRDYTREAAELRNRIALFAYRHGVRDEGVSLFDMAPEKLPAPWPLLIHLVEAYGLTDETKTVAGLLALLDRLEPKWWEEALEQAAQYEELLQEIRTVEIQLAALTGDTSETGIRLVRLRNEIGELRLATAPFDENSNIVELTERLKACKKAQDDVAEFLTIREQATAKAGELAEKLCSLREKEVLLSQPVAPLLAGGESPESLLVLWRNVQDLKRELEQAEKELAAVLRAHGVKSPEELQAAATDAANRALGILQPWENLLQEFPGLPGTGKDDPAVLEEQYRQLTEAVRILREESVLLHEKARELEFSQARLQGQSPVNLATGMDRLRILRERQKRLQREAAALQKAHQELDRAIHTYSASYRQELADRSSYYFKRITGVTTRKIIVDEDFSVRLSEDGRDCAVAHLSQGARDQLYLALRLAIADLLSGQICLPFLLDDPFVNWDEKRRTNIRDALTVLSQNRQIILLSHNPVFAAWGKSCTIHPAGGRP
jgi:uncharacterized protein YhaN